MTVMAPPAPMPEGLPLAQAQRGGSTDLVNGDLIWVVGNKITAHPRSAQKEIGPSEIGTPCARKLALKLAGAGPSNVQVPARSWRSTVGVAVHAWLADACEAFNRQVGETRYLTETRVSVGEIDGTEITGSCDLYDVVNACVVDFKVVGPTTLKSARRAGPSPTYRVQTQLYGRGYVRAGFPVDHVAVLYLPAAGDLTDAVWSVAPYDEAAAVAALARADALAVAMRLVGPAAVVAQANTADDYCNSCPFYRPRWTGDPMAGCPGHEKRSDVDGLLGGAA